MASKRKKEDIDYTAVGAAPSGAGDERQTFFFAGEAWLGNVRRVRKPATHEFYLQRLKVATPWMADNGVVYVDQLTPKKLRAYRDWRLDHIGVSPATARHDEISLKQLTKYARRMGAVTYDPLRDYDPLRTPKVVPSAASEGDLHRILRAIETTRLHVKRKNYSEMRYVNARDRMILLTQIETGSRSGEVISATRASLLRDRGMVHFLSSGMAETRKNGDDLIVQAQADVADAAFAPRAGDLLILGVLGRGDESEVAARAVEAVAVKVINLDALRGLQNESVEEEPLDLPLGVFRTPGVLVLPAPMPVPRVLHVPAPVGEHPRQVYGADPGAPRLYAVAVG